MSLARLCLLVYIRIKRLKGISYAYLVKSQWDRRKGVSIQHIIKYLGRSDVVAINDIPAEYQNDPEILSFLSSHRSIKQPRKHLLLNKMRLVLFEAMCSANRKKAMKVAANYQTLFNLIEFYDDLLIPVMYRIGDLWAQGRLSIITEHICSNIAGDLVHVLNAQNKPKSSKGVTVLICSPEGELHRLAIDILESVLLQNGYRVYNAAPFVSVDSIISSISRWNVHLVMISVTLEEHLRSAIRLSCQIRKELPISILIGGSAIVRLKEQEKRKIEQTYNIFVLTETSLKTTMNMVEVLVS